MRKHLALGLCLLGHLAVSQPVSAEELPTQLTAHQAIGLGRSGLEKFHAEQWQDALSEFSAANDLMHSPVFGLYIARCLQKLGRWTEARRKYQQEAEVELAATAPEPWQQARITARDELQALAASFPRVQLRWAASAANELTVNIDGQSIPFEQGDVTLELDPGDHELNVLWKARPLETRHFTLSPGKEPLQLQIGPYPPMSSSPPKALEIAAVPHQVPAAPRAGKAQALTNSLQAPLSERRRALRQAATVGLGVSVVGAVIGGITGITAWRERDAIAEQCTDGWHCPEALSGRITRGETLATISTLAFVAASVSLGTAGILFYLAPSNPDCGRVGQGSAPPEIGISGRF